MSKVAIAPEGVELANKYLETQSLEDTARAFSISVDKVEETLNKAAVKRYIDSIYMDTGYRNRFKLGALLDRIIDEKLAECEESEMYSGKDILDLMHLAHKMRMEELKAQQSVVANQTNVQINAEGSVFGSGNYGALMSKLLGEPKDVTN